jgi:PhnB protein
VHPAWDRAVAAGATVNQSLGEVFWGDLHGQLTDPFGHRWNLSQHLRDVSPADQQAALNAMFAPPA